MIYKDIAIVYVLILIKSCPQNPKKKSHVQKGCQHLIREKIEKRIILSQTARRTESKLNPNSNSQTDKWTKSLTLSIYLVLKNQKPQYFEDET